VTAGDSAPPAGRPLGGRVALVTGVSRRIGIGMAVARRLADLGADLFLTSWTAHDRDQPWGADPGGTDAVLAELGAGRGPRIGHLDMLVCNHARSSDGGLGELTAAELDACFAVNTRAVLLLVQAFAARHDGRPGGRVVLFTSGQQLGPMSGELAYATSKAALAGVTLSLADTLADRGITVNAVNPGPTDTGYADPAVHERVARRFPGGRWGTPDDAARLVAWLCTDDGAWITGQVINSEGGFRRFS
jgi:3-oxoacyl-[acyl-carrier protein] reductase